MKYVLFLALAAGAVRAQSWMPQQSGTTASLRGVSAVSAKVEWASGTKGTVLITTDGGASWQARPVPGAADLDFRDLHAVNDRMAYLLSAGEGPASRIYKTTDGGGRWTLLFTNPEPKGFFDAIGFWDESHGIVLGDPADGRFTILTTSDGATWQRRKGPQAGKNESAFAASGTCLVTRGTREAWFATGGPGGARVFHSADGGETWSVAKTPLRNDSASAGIFSLAFSGARHGVAVGGDYQKAGEAAGNIAISEDGGRTWTAPRGTAPGGFRSAVAHADGIEWIAVGTAGSDVSADGGVSWRKFDDASFYAVGFAPDGAGWAVGPNGAIARFAP